jgi:protein-disulfide isomerase
MRSLATSWRLALAPALATILIGCGAGGDSGDAATPTPETIAERLAQLPYEGLPTEGTFVGDPEAPILIEMYEDFGCPHCLDFTADIEPFLLSEYVEDGDVRLQYRFYPLRQLTANAAMAAYCAAEQNSFWPYHTQLFIMQAAANDGSGPPLTEAFEPESLRAEANALGLDVAAFDACTESDAVIEEITADLRAGAALNIPGTPSFVINDELLRQVPDDRAGWQELLDRLIAE